MTPASFSFDFLSITTPEMDDNVDGAGILLSFFDATPSMHRSVIIAKINTRDLIFMGKKFEANVASMHRWNIKQILNSR